MDWLINRLESRGYEFYEGWCASDAIESWIEWLKRAFIFDEKKLFEELGFKVQTFHDFVEMIRDAEKTKIHII